MSVVQFITVLYMNCVASFGLTNFMSIYIENLKNSNPKNQMSGGFMKSSVTENNDICPKCF